MIKNVCWAKKRPQLTIIKFDFVYITLTFLFVFFSGSAKKFHSFFNSFTHEYCLKKSAKTVDFFKTYRNKKRNNFSELMNELNFSQSIDKRTRINHNHIIRNNKSGRFAILSYLCRTPRKRKKVTWTQALWLHCSAISNYIGNGWQDSEFYAKAFFQHLSRPYFATESSIKLDPGVHVTLLTV